MNHQHSDTNTNSRRGGSFEQGAEFDDLLDSITERLQRGESIESREFADQPAEIRDRIEELLPTLRAMASWHSGIHGGTPTDLAHGLRLDDEATPNISVPRELGDYKIIRQLGRGGMGVVYEAEQISLGRRVALKLLLFAGLFDETNIKRFKNEARSAAMLKHPNIVSVIAIGTERGIHYYVMELIDGQSLSEIIPRLHSAPIHTNSMEFADPVRKDADTDPKAMLSTIQSGDRRAFYRGVAKLGVQAARALEYAHQEGVIHRDVKPSNLMLDNSGNLFVTDFGLARIRAGDNLTQTGELVGTLRYMSPERVEDGVPVDHRADIYGLAATLYEMVANRPVVEGDTGEQILRNLIETRPPSLPTIDRQVPRDFATVLHKALEKEPSDRYRTAAEFADDLQRVVDNRTIRARHVRGHERLFRWAKRNPLLSISLLTVMPLLAVLAVGGFQAAPNADRANEQLLASNYASDILVANIAAESGSLLHAERILLKWMPEKNGGRDLRHFEWFHLWNRTHSPAIEQTIQYRFPVLLAPYTKDESEFFVGWWSSNLDVWDAKQPQFASPIRRIEGRAFGTSAACKLRDRNKMLFGDAKDSLGKIVSELKNL